MKYKITASLENGDKIKVNDLYLSSIEIQIRWILRRNEITRITISKEKQK